MATYYVRASMGNDGNDGLSPAQAWLTIDHAASNVAAGDTVYIGSGRYEEQVTMDVSGNNGNVISYIGDIDGVETGDPGPAIITGFNAPIGAAARTWTIDLNNKTFITFQYLHIISGTSHAVTDNSAAASLSLEQITIQDCWIACASNPSIPCCFRLDVQAGTAPGTTGLRLLRSQFWGPIFIDCDCNAVAHVDMNIRIENNVFIGGDFGSVMQYGIWMQHGVNDTFSLTGIEINHNAFFGHEQCTYFQWTKDAVTPSVKVQSNFFFTGVGVQNNDAAANSIYEDWNYQLGLYSTGGTAGRIQSGGNSMEYNDWEAPLFGGLADLMFYKKLGWSPWKPWEPMVTQDPSVYAPALVDQDSTPGLTGDLYDNPRPMQRNVSDVGAVEARSRGEEETGTVRSGSSSLKFSGQGYHDFQVPVDASATTVEAYGRFDANYTGAKPILRVYNIPGVADQSDIMTGGSGSWEKLECVFTPSEAGYIRVRLEGQDTSASGECFFDDVRIK